MKPFAKAYAIVVSLLGLFVGVLCVIEYIQMISASSNLGQELGQLFVLFLLAFLCRCLPIYMNPTLAIDMAFISNFAILLCKGPVVAAAITLVTTPFVFVPKPGKEKGYYTVFNTPLIKTAFNNANLTLSVYLGGLAFAQFGGIVGDLSFPGLTLPAIAMIFTVMVVNSALLLFLFKLNAGLPFFRSFSKNLLSFLPSVIAAAPIGYFIAKFALMEGGSYLVIMFVLPLLLARFSFSLYVNVKQNYFTMVKTLTNTLEAKDDYTSGHSERVEIYSKIIASEMHISPSRIEELSVAALLHDIGKIGIDENILNKPSSLSPEEKHIIQTHPEISILILKDVKLTPLELKIIRHHHERYDGLGYPDGLGKDALPLEVYAIGVADTYDAITSDRPYSQGRSPEVAKEIIREESGRQFHPDAVAAFLRAYEKGKLNTDTGKSYLQTLSVG